MLDRVRRRAWGLSGRLIASYILVTLAVVVLVEALVLGFQVPQLVNGAQLQGPGGRHRARATPAAIQRYPACRPEPCSASAPSRPAEPGGSRPGPGRARRDGTLAVPAITGPIHGHQAVTAVVAIAADGTVVASSAPSRYPPGRAAASELPVPVTIATGRRPARQERQRVHAVRQRGPGWRRLAWSAWPGTRSSTSRRRGRPGSSTPSAPGTSWCSSASPRAAVGPVRAAPRHRAGRRAVRAAGLTPPRPPGTPPGTSHPRGRRRRLHRHPARLRPG